MINVYESYRDTDGNAISNRTILFLKDSDIAEGGNINTYAAGPGVAADVSGRIFIVDDWLIEQIDKVQFIDGTLSVKDGEALILPVKTEKELQIEAIERQLAALKAEPDVATEENTDTELLVEKLADTEEQMEEVFDEYDEIINDDYRQKPAE